MRSEQFFRLRTEYADSPLGIDLTAPLFSWQGPKARIVVRRGETVVWDSGKLVESPVCYRGKALRPRTAYCWELTGEGGGSASSGFETGLMGDYSGSRWISDPSLHGAWKRMNPVSKFVKWFDRPEKPVRIRLYATALGAWSGTFNGVPIGDGIMLPGWTEYASRVLYHTFDLTAGAESGANRLEILLGDGWFSGTMAKRQGMPGSGPESSIYGFHPYLRAALMLDYSDGRSEVIGTDRSWLCSCKGPYEYSDIYTGESFRADRPWEEFHPAADEYLPRDVRYAVPDEQERLPGAEIVSANGAPVVRCVEVRKPVSRVKRPSGEWILDFGQNFTGRERCIFRAPAGTKIHLRHGEMLQNDGSLYAANLRRAKAETWYVSNGKAEPYEPLFTFFGFRYLEVSGCDDFTIEARVLTSDMEQTSRFECSNPLLNRFSENVRWGQRSNFFDIPTDCPQRDERLGWMGDAQIFIPTALYQQNGAGFFRKWLADVDLCRTLSGEYPAVVPPVWGRGTTDRGRDMCGQAGWGDAGFICPYTCYLFYGDVRFFTDRFDVMLRAFRGMMSRAEDFICKDAIFGDWLNLDDPTSPELLATAYACRDARIMILAARKLRRPELGYLRQMEAALRKAYQKRFFNRKGELLEVSQTARAITLAFGLAPRRSIARTAAQLDRAIRENGVHLTTGFLGTPCLLRALSDNGFLETAYALLEQTTYPSWLYPVTCGATTIWERWNSFRDGQFGDVSMNSFNHYAYGAAMEWLYAVAAGIRPDTDDPGFRKVLLDPRPGGSLQWLKAEYDSPAGRIKSAWKRLPSGKVEYTFTVPAGVKAFFRGRRELQEGETTLTE